MSKQTEQIESLRQDIRQRIAMGFDEPARIVEFAVECCGEGDGDELTRQAAVIYRELAAEHAERQRSWPVVTDCDRLDAAFEQLNAMGIMARHHWWCCGNCGAAAMPAEVERLDGKWEGKPIIGYTFYHVQGTESAADGYGLCLSYGSTEPAASAAAYEAQSVRIAELVRDTLRKHGLEIVWDGTYSKRLNVRIDWKRRAKPPRFCE